MTLNKLAIFAAALFFSFSLNSASINSEESDFNSKIIFLQQQISKDAKSDWAVKYLNAVLLEYELKLGLKEVIAPAMLDCVKMTVIVERADLMKYFYKIFLKCGGKPSVENFIDWLTWAIKSDGYSLVPTLFEMALASKIKLNADNLAQVMKSIKPEQILNDD